jgi:hypothetical protein
LSANEEQNLQPFDQQAFESKLPFMGLSYKALTVQQEKFVHLYISGMTAAAAARAAGYTDRNAGFALMKNEKVAKAISFLREEMREEVKFTLANAHKMYMEAYTSSANATEMKNTTDSLVKLHGLAAPDPSTQVNINVTNVKQLETLSDADLLKLAGKDSQYLDPKKVIDADYEEKK